MTLVTFRLAMKELVLASGDGGISGRRKDAGQIEALTSEEDEAYFSSYGHFSIHQEMLQVEAVVFNTKAFPN